MWEYESWDEESSSFKVRRSWPKGAEKIAKEYFEFMSRIGKGTVNCKLKFEGKVIRSYRKEGIDIRYFSLDNGEGYVPSIKNFEIKKSLVVKPRSKNMLSRPGRPFGGGPFYMR